MSLEKLEEQLENLQMVRYRMDAEGFHYCFKHYSSFKEVEDEKFHELRREYLKIANELEQYVHNKISELEDEVNNHYSNDEE
jgi:Zn-finger domain-containing protein